jgi:hypothetical protein
VSIEPEKESTVKCVFCGKQLEKSEIVRYRGAISCRDCAKEHGPTKQFNERPFYIIAGLGCIIPIPAILYMVIHGLMFAPLPGPYAPPLTIYFTALIISIPMQAVGLYALNWVELPRAAILTTVLSFVIMLIQTASLYDFILGPTYVVESIAFPKDYLYYSLATTTYTFFMATAGVAILLGLGRTRLDNPAAAAAAMYILGSGTNLFQQILPTVGFVHVFIYAVAFVFFMTREDVNEPESISSVGYHPMDKEAS